MSDNGKPMSIDASSISTGYLVPQRIARTIRWERVIYLILVLVVLALGVFIGYQQHQINILETKVGILDVLVNNLRQSM